MMKEMENNLPTIYMTNSIYSNVTVVGLNFCGYMYFIDNIKCFFLLRFI